MQSELKNLLIQNDIRNVVLKGQVKNIQTIIPQYDLVVMSSTFEGCSLGVLEAMALEMPLLLSDIESFREQCGDTAVYFKLEDPADFVNKLKALASDKSAMKQLGESGRIRVLENFTLDIHMKGLRRIYSDALTG